MAFPELYGEVFGADEEDLNLFGYEDGTDDDFDSSQAAASDAAKPRILLMGLPRSGKSSIQKVVFQKMSPNETHFLETTTQLTKSNVSNSSFVNFQIWDFPGQIDFLGPAFDSKAVFGAYGALVFVIDALEDFAEALQKLHQAILHAHSVNRHLHFEVFLHKVDGLSTEQKIAASQHVMTVATEQLAQAKLGGIPLNFYLTSIYDCSVFEAFSKVVQKLIPQLPALEKMLDILVRSCQLDKAFLFDLASKVYIATDSSRVELPVYELCSDLIDVCLDISSIYGSSSTDAPAFDEQSRAVVRLSSSQVLAVREINQYLALACVVSEPQFARSALLEYNIDCFRKAMTDMFLRASSAAKPGGGESAGGSPSGAGTGHAAAARVQPASYSPSSGTKSSKQFSIN